MRRFIAPLTVHLCWPISAGVDPACAAIARELYEILHRPIGDDPAHRPGLEIPIAFGRALPGLVDAFDRGELATGAHVVVVILDRAGFASATFRDAVLAAATRFATPGRIVLAPIVLYPPWRDLIENHPRLVPGADRRWQLGTEIAVLAGQALADDRATRPRVFISHVRADGRDRAAALAAHLATRTRLGVWYDDTGAGAGDEMLGLLEAAGGDGVLLVIRTDHYSESPWSTLELLAAKLGRAPIVTVFDGRDGEPAMSAYGGNHRFVVWRDDRAWEVVARCAQAWLDHRHFTAHAAAALAHAGLPAGAELVPRRPELIDLVSASGSGGRRIIVYPDPPMIEREAALLRAAQPAVRLVTPSTMLGKVLLASDPSPPLADRTIAISLSHAPGLRRLTDAPDGSGLVAEHLEDVLSTVVLTALQTGARIAYGGDFRARDGYAVALANLHRARRRLGTGRGSQLLCLVDEAGPREGDADVEHWPLVVEVPAGLAAQPAAVRDVLWQLAMRDQMTARCDARIVLGGELHAAETDDGPGYRGPWPGVLEEAWRTLTAGQALYLLGGLGGCAGALCQMLADDAVPALFAEQRADSRAAAVAAEVARARAALADTGAWVLRDGDRLLTMGDLAAGLLARWRRFVAGDAAAWPNGLDVDDNRRLFRSIDRTEIAQLVFAGLRRIARRPADTLDRVLYRGDLTAVADVDGYAVTATPGLPHAGALAALDRRCGGRLGPRIDRVRWEHPVEVVAIDSDALAGRTALVAHLPLPASGAAISAADVEELGAEVARTADRLGIASLAITPFATSLGVPAADSVAALLRGLQRGRGALPRTVVICEADPERHAAIRGVAGADARELRAGPAPAPAADTVVLHVGATAAAAGGSIALRTTAYVLDSGAPLVPHHDVVLTRGEWDGLRRYPATFAATRQRGHELAARALSAEMVELLDRHADRRVLVITDLLGSGLPWEMLATVGGPPAIAGGMIRRITTPGARAASRLQAQASVRVLLIVDPTGDLDGAEAEGDAVASALRGRPDVELTILRGADAHRAGVCAALAAGRHDVLHYAGHASFDAAALDRSGLRLADGELVAADLAVGAPRLVVLGACQSARIRDAGATPAPVPAPVMPLAEAFLRAGVSTLIGTFFPVDDHAALQFSSALHTALGAGQAVGAAVGEARRALHAARRADWGNFVLYGDDQLVL